MGVGMENSRVLVPEVLVSVAMAMNQIGRPQDSAILQDDLGGAGREDAPILAEDDHSAGDLRNDVEVVGRSDHRLASALRVQDQLH